MNCPKCGSKKVSMHERLANNRNRYRCKACGNEWRDEAVKKREVEKDDEIDGNIRRISTRSLDITSIEELLEYSKISEDIWEVSKGRVKTSEVTISGQNTSSGEPETYTNYHVSAELKKREPTVDAREDIREIIEEAKNYAPNYKPVEYSEIENGTLLQISLFDHHFGQLSWGDETGQENYDIQIAEELAHKAIDKIISQANWGRISKILLITGNDFFNVDNIANTTQGGTPQAEDGRWKKTFRRGRQLWVSIIEKLMHHAHVDIVNVLGNHAPQREYYLADSLECWFAKCPNVTIDNTPPDRKYYTFGKVLFGLTHGHKEVKNSLVQIMATEHPDLWANSKFRVWFLGHWHFSSAKIYQPLDEDHGVRIEILPSLVPTDDWHAGKGYSALRQTIANEWHPEYGNIGSIVVSSEMLK